MISMPPKWPKNSPARRRPSNRPCSISASWPGLGNIYVAEALHRAHILPTVLAGTLVTARGKPKAALEDLASAVRQVLIEAIEAGGSTLRDFRNAEGGNRLFPAQFRRL